MTQNKVVQLDTGSHEEKAGVGRKSKDGNKEVLRPSSVDMNIQHKQCHKMKFGEIVPARYQTALNDISTWHAVGLYWVPGHAGVRGNEIADKLARGGSCQKFIRPEPFIGVSRQNIKRLNAGWITSIW